MNWGYVWMSLAAAVVLVVTLGIYSYEFGKNNGHEVVRIAPNTPDARLDALEQQLSDAYHERELLKTQLAERDGMIAGLRREMVQQSAVLADAKSAQSNLEQSLENGRAEQQQLAQERSTLAQKLESVQASL
jgi:chromosome segregation ATPase